MKKIPDPLLVELMKDSVPDANLTFAVEGKDDVSTTSEAFLEQYQEAIANARIQGAHMLLQHIEDTLYAVASSGLLEKMLPEKRDQDVYLMSLKSVVIGEAIALEEQVIDFTA